MELSFAPVMMRFLNDCVAALGTLTPTERSLAAIAVALELGAVVCLRALTRRRPPAVEAAEFDEAA